MEVFVFFSSAKIKLLNVLGSSLQNQISSPAGQYQPAGFPSLPGVSPLAQGVQLSVAQLPLSTRNFLQWGLLTKPPSVKGGVVTSPTQKVKQGRAGLLLYGAEGLIPSEGWCRVLRGKVQDDAQAPDVLMSSHVTTVERLILLMIFPLDLLELFLTTVAKKATVC